MPRESKFEFNFIEEVKRRFPGAVILKNDPNYLQGFPDRTILYHDRWAVLEFKRSIDSPRQPNQEYYVDLAMKMSYGSFVYPENELRIINELQQALRHGWPPRLFKR